MAPINKNMFSPTRPSLHPVHFTPNQLTKTRKNINTHYFITNHSNPLPFITNFITQHKNTNPNRNNEIPLNIRRSPYLQLIKPFLVFRFRSFLSKRKLSRMISQILNRRRNWVKFRLASKRICIPTFISEFSLFHRRLT